MIQITLQYHYFTIIWTKPALHINIIFFSDLNYNYFNEVMQYITRCIL